MQGRPADAEWRPEELLVHRSPLLLLDRIVQAADESCTAEASVDPAAWYADLDGSMPGWFGIELMAQTAAACSGSRKVAAGRSPLIGYLLGTQRYDCQVPRFPAGALLRIETRLLFQDESGLGAFACEISHDGQVLARATLKAFDPQ
jgi:predicted hotdog family 3-hydroxylacyl-ACP dehydratase